MRPASALVPNIQVGIRGQAYGDREYEDRSTLPSLAPDLPGLFPGNQRLSPLASLDAAPQAHTPA